MLMIERKLKKELYKIENKKNLSDKEKKKNYDNLFELVRTLDKKEKYKYHDCLSLLLKDLFNAFLNNYQKQEIILRNGINFVFESVDLLSCYIHKTSMKRENWYIKSSD